MKNSDMPAMPISEEETDRIDDGVKIYSGLTKLEHFAGLAMQGFLSNPLEVRSTEGKTLLRFIAVCSVDYAQALLDEMETRQ